MKTFPKLLIPVFALITATSCSDDGNESKQLSSRELLTKYDWIVFSAEWEVLGPAPEPDEVYIVLSFDETTYSGSDYGGEFHEFGDWSLEDGALILDGESLEIFEFTKKRLIYEHTDGRIITRVPVAKIN